MKVIGIDLGTTDSVIAVMEGSVPVIVPNAEGDRVTPSIVAFDPETGSALVGIAGKRQAVINPENTIYSIKRFMGCQWGKSEWVGKEVGCKAYKVIKGSYGGARVAVGKRDYSPSEISAMILRKLKADAEVYLGDEVSEAVVTVPAYFNDNQRQATKAACLMAGLRVLRIISEPTAACLAYGLNRRGDETVAAYHLGGGTFDISILELGGDTFQVKSTNGDTHLGGDDFDQRIIDWLCAEFKKDQGIDLKQDKTALQRLKEAAEKAKCELSTVLQTEVNLPFITADASGLKHLNINLTRAKLEQLTGELVDKTVEPCKQALTDAGVTARDINRVILVGGQTRMPLVQERIEQIFGKEPSKAVNPDEVVAMGAAIQAGVLKGEVSDVLLLDVTPLTLAIETLGGVATPLIPRNTTIPNSKSQIFSTTADNQPSVEIHVVQGERPMATDNGTLGRFILDGILPAARGVPQVEVAFEIDANGILSVRAHDKGTGKEQSIVLAAYSGLSPAEVDYLTREEREAAHKRREAEARRKEEARLREEARIHEEAETLIASMENTLVSHRHLLPACMQEAFQSRISALHAALQGKSVEKVRSGVQDLKTSFQWVKLLEEGQAQKAVDSLAEHLTKEDDGHVRDCIRQTLSQMGGARVGEILRPRSRIDKILGRRRWVDG